MNDPSHIRPLLEAIEALLNHEVENLPKELDPEGRTAISGLQIERFRGLCRFSQVLQCRPEDVVLSLSPCLDAREHISAIEIRVGLKES